MRASAPRSRSTRRVQDLACTPSTSHYAAQRASCRAAWQWASSAMSVHKTLVAALPVVVVAEEATGAAGVLLGLLL